MVLGLAEHAPVGEVHGGPQPVGVEREAGVDAVGPGVLLVFAGPANEPGHGLDREPRGDFAGGVPAHPVGDDQQPEGFVLEQRVFVGAPDRTSVGASSRTHPRQRWLLLRDGSEIVVTFRVTSNATLVVFRRPAARQAPYG